MIGTRLMHGIMDPGRINQATVQVYGQTAVPIGIDLQAHTGPATMGDGEGGAGTAIRDLRGFRIPLPDHPVLQEQGTQQGHGRLGQTGGLGKIGPAQRHRRTQNGIDDDREVVIPQIILINRA